MNGVLALKCFCVCVRFYARLREFVQRVKTGTGYIIMTIGKPLDTLRLIVYTV